MSRYVLPCWVFGVLVSFLLPVVPPLWVWIAGYGVMLLVAWRWKPVAVLLCVLFGMAYGIWRTELALARQWPVARVENVALTVVVDDLPRADEKRIQLVAKAWDKDGGEYRLMLSDYQLRDWPVGSRWRISARLRPIIGEVNLRGLNREVWALANGLDGVGTVGKGRVLLGQDDAWQVTAWRENISRHWQQLDTGKHDFSDGVGLMRALSIGEQGGFMAGVPTVGIDAFGEHFWATCHDGGAFVGLVDEAGIEVGAVDAKKAAIVDTIGWYAGCVVLCSIGRFFCADAAQCIDVVCFGLGMVAR